MSDNVWYRAADGTLHKGQDIGFTIKNGHKYRKIVADGQEMYVTAEVTGELKEVPDFKNGVHSFSQNRGVKE